MKLRLTIPKPNNDIYDFKGGIEYNFGSENLEEDSASDDMTGTQFIPRGATIKNSGTISAIVVYTGVETKLMQNLGTYKFKRSESEKRVGKQLIFNLGLLVLFAFIASLWNGLKTREMYDKHDYIFAAYSESATEMTLTQVISFWLLFNYLIPLDLAVMLEVN